MLFPARQCSGCVGIVISGVCDCVCVCLSVCPRSKTKTTRAVNAELDTHELYGKH